MLPSLFLFETSIPRTGCNLRKRKEKKVANDRNGRNESKRLEQLDFEKDPHIMPYSLKGIAILAPYWLSFIGQYPYSNMVERLLQVYEILK